MLSQNIFFPQRLARVQFNKIQSPLKEQSKNRRLDEEPQGSRTGCLFCTALRARSINKIQSPLRTQKENRGLTDKSPDFKSGHLFPAAFSPCSIQ
ncbi:hypothetical protein A0O21_07190 [Streptococcus pantholopis]|uniref:Uncharacterized protein n=1 Tax=Streptococcus pantholopis TaxID=1811193 RepID=A0A172Q8Q7_9STRE|nr:hypothetical protein A0O21_07190 [Streptococcus pantholopis]